MTIIIFLVLSCTAFGQSKLDLLTKKCQKTALIEEDRGMLDFNLKDDTGAKWLVENLNLVLNDAVQDSVVSNKYYVKGTYTVNIVVKYAYDKYLGRAPDDHHMTDTKKFTATAKEMLGDFIVSDFKSGY